VSGEILGKIYLHVKVVVRGDNMENFFGGGGSLLSLYNISLNDMGARGDIGEKMLGFLHYL